MSMSSRSERPSRWDRSGAFFIMGTAYRIDQGLSTLIYNSQNKAMQRQRGELVPIGEVVSGLDDVLVPAIRDATPQARHCFTVADQVNQLVSAREADPNRSFMARMMALCSLPRSNPGNRLQYRRVNGPYKLVMIAGADKKLPYGNLPRLLLA